MARIETGPVRAATCRGMPPARFHQGCRNSRHGNRHEQHPITTDQSRRKRTRAGYQPPGPPSNHFQATLSEGPRARGCRDGPQESFGDRPSTNRRQAGRRNAAEAAGQEQGDFWPGGFPWQHPGVGLDGVIVAGQARQGTDQGQAGAQARSRAASAAEPC
jgi:hypothetical protein